jgi:hypothetical protein
LFSAYVTLVLIFYESELQEKAMPRRKRRSRLANLQGSKHDATPVATTADDVNEANATVNGEGTNEVSDDSDGEDFCEECAGQIVYFGAKITNWFPVIRGAVASTQGEALSMSHIHSFPPQALLHSSFYLAPLPALSLFTITGAEEEGASSADEGISLCYSDGENGTADFSMEMESDGEAGDESVAASTTGVRTSKRTNKYSGSMRDVGVRRPRDLYHPMKPSCVTQEKEGRSS